MNKLRRLSLISFNNDNRRAIRNSFHCYIGVTVRRFNGLTRRSRSSFAWHAVASREAAFFVVATAI
jgi:hypothetical protein